MTECVTECGALQCCRAVGACEEGGRPVQLALSREYRCILGCDKLVVWNYV